MLEKRKVVIREFDKAFGHEAERIQNLLTWSCGTVFALYDD